MNKEDTNTILHTLETQLDQRLEKLWRVFGWCSSILISLTAGVLAAAASTDYNISGPGNVIISIIIIIVTVYARAWILENLVFERNIRDRIDKIFEDELNYPQLKALSPDRARFGYSHVILLLGLIALLSVWKEDLLIQWKA